MARSITLRFHNFPVPAASQGCYLRITAVNAVDMPKEIFVFKRSVPSAMNAVMVKDEFIKVAEPNALQEYGVDVPAVGSEECYYRRDTVDLVFRDAETRTEAWNLIDECVKKLVVTLNQQEMTPSTTDVTYD